MTLVSENGAPDEVYEQACEQFTEAELISLTMAVITINGWNRLNASFRPVPGDYQSQRQPRPVLNGVPANG